MRAAITCANANPGLDTISFNIPGAGVHTITPLSPLPAITDPVTIDGYTQPGASVNTGAFGATDNAVLQIELSGASLKTSGRQGNKKFGLVIFKKKGGGARSKGFSSKPVVGGGVVVKNPTGNAAGNITISGNFIGTGSDWNDSGRQHGCRHSIQRVGWQHDWRHGGGGAKCHFRHPG